MKVLVTGSSGRLGPYVIRDLQEAGHEVVLFSRRQPAEEFGQLSWVEGDIADADACGRALQAAVRNAPDATQPHGPRPWAGNTALRGAHT